MAMPGNDLNLINLDDSIDENLFTSFSNKHGNENFDSQQSDMHISHSHSNHFNSKSQISFMNEEFAPINLPPSPPFQKISKIKIYSNEPTELNKASALLPSKISKLSKETAQSGICKGTLNLDENFKSRIVYKSKLPRIVKARRNSKQ